MENEKDKNLEYLKNDLKYLGFGDTLYPHLEEKLAEKPDKFKLLHTGEFVRPDGTKDSVSYQIDFNKSESSERYFLNSYRATLKNDTDPTQEKSQLFYVNKGSGITAKEAYNMLSGRSVHKEQTNRENEKYKAWLQLDFNGKEPNGNFKVKQFHQNYGFDLPQTLANYPIKELTDPNGKISLLRGLEKGDIKAATFMKDGKEEKVFITTSPQFKNLNVFDSNMKPKLQESEKKQQEPDKKKEQKESVKTDGDEDESQKDKKKPKRKSVKV